MRSETVTLGELNCRIIRPAESSTPEVIVVLCHGFGAPGTDLVPLASEFLRCRPELEDRVQFVFPEGPQTIPEVPGGRCWWPIDMLELQTSIAEGRFREMRQSVPPLLPDATARLSGVLNILQEQTAVPWSRFVLGGFSQGSMLATDVALRMEHSPGGLIIYSGTLLAEPEWKKIVANRAGLKVLQTHGTLDPLLPFEAALWLRELLTEAGLEVDFHSFSGMHTIPGEAITSSAEFVSSLLPSES